jgi:hypothetical protein
VKVTLANPAKLAFATFAATAADAANATMASEPAKSFLSAYVYTLEVSRQSGSYRRSWMLASGIARCGQGSCCSVSLCCSRKGKVFLFSDSLLSTSHSSVSLLGTKFHDSLCARFVFSASALQRQSSNSSSSPFSFFSILIS